MSGAVSGSGGSAASPTELPPERRQQNGEELANALTYLAGELRAARRKDSIDALGNAIDLYHRGTHGDATPLLVVLISACNDLAAALVEAKRRHDAIKLLDTAIALQRVVDRRRRGRKLGASFTSHSFAGRSFASASSPLVRGASQTDLDVHQVGVIDMLLRRAALLFESGHYLLAARDWIVVESALSSAAQRARSGLNAAGRACADNLGLADGSAAPNAGEEVRLDKMAAAVTALQGELAQLRVLHNATRNALIENIATSLRVYGCYGEAKDWLVRCEDPSDRVLGHLALCDLVRAPRKPDEVAAAIALARSCSTGREALAASLGIVQAVVQHFLSSSAVDVASQRGLDDEEAVRVACDAVLPALTHGAVKTLDDVASGLPESLMTADKHIVHSVITTINFATSFAALDVWNAVLGEATGKLGVRLGRAAPPPPIEAVAVQRIPGYLAESHVAPLVAVDSMDAAMLQSELDRIAAEIEAFGVGGPGSPFAHEIAAAAAPVLAGASRPELKVVDLGSGTRVPASIVDKGVSPTVIEREFGIGESPAETAAGDGDGSILDEPFSPHVRDMSAESGGTILNAAQRRALHDCLPLQYQRLHWRCAYSSRQHGTSMNTLLTSVFEAGPPVLLVVQAPDAIIGAFLTTQLRVGSRYTGNGESLVFSFRAADVAELECYRWAHTNDYFCLVKRDTISIGGGGRGPAIKLRESLCLACSSACETFRSPPLTAITDDDDFEVHAVEVLAIDFTTPGGTSPPTELAQQPQRHRRSFFIEKQT